MPPKRPLESSPTSGAAKESKRAKTRAARTIDVEAPPARLPSASTSAGVNVATPASSIARPQIRFTADSLKGLPNAFEVEKFVEARSSLPSVARSFEIGAMQRAMENVRPVWDLALSYFGLVVISSGDASKRVWQTLPRHMRRRTASHDVRRVPVRLRVKALAEMDPMKRKKKLKTLRKIGKAFEIGRTARLLKRQRDKAWLETHIWHAKRMKMENLWGYRLALHPTEKAFRSSYRASTTTSILHDSSYYGILELSGPENVLKEILTACCDPFAPVTAPRFLSGARACETFIYKPNSWPFELLSPILVLWKALDPSVKDTTLSPSIAKKQQTKFAAPQPNLPVRSASTSTTSITSKPPIRVVWLHIHPAAFTAVHHAVHTVAASVLQRIRLLSSQATASSHGGRTEDVELEISDLRTCVCAFELVGPLSQSVLAGALKLSPSTVLESKKAFRALGKVPNPGCIPKGMVLGLEVEDPRLSFPPKNLKPDKADKHSFTTQPTAEISRSRLWDASVREKLAKPKYKKAELDARRSKNLVPGTPLQPLPSDDRIPLIIVQRTIGASASSSRHTMRSMNGFLILFPAGWSMPFLTSLTHTGTRVGGLRERRLQRFESGIGSWPEDFIGVGAIDQGKRTAEVTRQKRKVKKGHFGDGSTYPDLSKSDWAVILGLQSPRRVGGQDQAVGDGERRPPGRDLIPTQPPPDASAMEELLDDLMRSAADLNSPLGPSGSSRPGGGAGAQTDIRSQIWLLRGSQAPTLFQNLATYATQKEVAECLWDRIDKYRVKRGLESLSTSAFTAKLPGPGAQVDERSAAAETLLNTALVAVRIQMCGAGVVGDSAVIYDDPGSGDNLGADEGGTHDNSQGAIEPQPEPASILGYVTTGHVSLQQGKGFAIGMVSLKQLVGIARRDMLSGRKDGGRNLLKVRGKGSGKGRLAWVDVVGDL